MGERIIVTGMVTRSEINAAIAELNAELPESVWQCPRLEGTEDDLHNEIEVTAIPEDMTTYVNRALSVNETDGEALVEATEELIAALNEVPNLSLSADEILRR